MRTRIPGLVHEAVADAPPAASGGETPPEPTPAPEPTPSPEPTPAPSEPDYGAMLSSPEGQQALERAAWEMFQQYGGEPEPQPEYPDPFAQLDPLDEGFGSQLGQGLQQMFGQLRADLMAELTGMPAFQAAEAQHHSAWAANEFSAIEQRLGAPVKDEHREMAITLAAGLRPPESHPQARFWDPGRALSEAHGNLHALIQRERADAVREYQTGLAGDGGAGASEPPASGQAAIHSEPVPANMREARLAWERRQGLHD